MSANILPFSPSEQNLSSYVVAADYAIKEISKGKSWFRPSLIFAVWYLRVTRVLNCDAAYTSLKYARTLPCEHGQEKHCKTQEWCGSATERCPTRPLPTICREPSYSGRRTNTLQVRTVNLTHTDIIALLCFVELSILPSRRPKFFGDMTIRFME